MSFDENTYEMMDRFLRGELRGEELRDYSESMNANPELKEETELFRQLVNAVKNEGRSTLKKQFALIGAAIPAGDFAAYTPSINADKQIKSKRSSLKKWIILSVTAILVAVAAYFIWRYFSAQEGESVPFFDGAPAPQEEQKDIEKSQPPAKPVEAEQKTDSAAIPKSVQVIEVGVDNPVNEPKKGHSVNAAKPAGANSNPVTDDSLNRARAKEQSARH